MMNYQQVNKLVLHLLDVECAEALVSAEYEKNSETAENKMPQGRVKSIKINYPGVMLTIDGLYDDTVYGKRAAFTLTTCAETNLDEEEKEARQKLIQEIAERISTAMEWEWIE